MTGEGTVNLIVSTVFLLIFGSRRGRLGSYSSGRCSASELGGNTFALCCRLANSPQNDQALIPRTCEYLTLSGKRDLADVTD